MFTWAVNYDLFVLTIFFIAVLFVILFAFDKIYRKRFEIFTNEMHKQYIIMLDNAKQQMKVNLINKAKLHDGICPYCGKKIEDN